MAYTILSGDPRAVGTGNPPVDVNNLNDVVTGMGGVFNVLNTAYAGGADPTGVADSTAAFQACLNAATAVTGEMTIPPGVYNLNTGNIGITGPVRIRGHGVALTAYPGVVPAGVLINSSATSTGHLFHFTNMGYLWGGLEVSGLSIHFSGTGDVFHQINIVDSAFRDCEITLTAAGSAAFQTSGSNSYLNIMHERVNIITTALVRTAPAVNIVTSLSGAISNTTWLKCKFTNQGLDNAQFMIYYACTGSGTAYHYADNFRDCWFEHPFGGCLQSLSGQNITIDGCMVWDIQNGQTVCSTTAAAGSNGGTISGIAGWSSPSAGVLAVSSIPAGCPTSGQLTVATSTTPAIVSYTGISGSTFTGCAYIGGSATGTVATGGAVSVNAVVGNSMYYIGAYAGNSGSQGTRIVGCGRNRNGPNGTTTWDVFCDALTSQTYIAGYTIKPDTASTYTPAYFNFSSHFDVTLVNNQSPQGSGVNGNSDTQITNPSTTQIAVGQGVINPQPVGSTGFVTTDLGYLAWTYDPGLIGGNSVLGSGVVNLSRVNVRAQISVTNLVCFVGVIGATLTSGQSIIGLYNSAGTRIGISADQSGAWVSTGLKTAALVGGPFVLTPGFYWVAWISVGTTPPQFGKWSGLGNAAIANAGAGSTTTYRTATNITGTALPSPLVLGSNAAGTANYWSALS